MFYFYWFVGLLLAIAASVVMASHYEFTHNKSQE